MIINLFSSPGRSFLSTLFLLIIFSIFASAFFPGEKQAESNVNPQQQATSNDSSEVSVLIVGGGSSHNFDRWFNLEDSKTISETGARVRYTDQPQNISAVLSQVDILYLSNNQPMPDTEAFRNSIFNFIENGNGLLLVHAPTWYNWKDWPEYNSELVGGGSRSHEPYGEFQVEITDTDHPIMESVPTSFSIIDELYHFEPNKSGKDIQVMAKGIVPESGEEYPIAWTLTHGKGRIVGLTLGHDGKAHYHYAYRTILKNSIEWLNKN